MRRQQRLLGWAFLFLSPPPSLVTVCWVLLLLATTTMATEVVVEAARFRNSGWMPRLHPNPNLSPKDSHTHPLYPPRPVLDGLRVADRHRKRLQYNPIPIPSAPSSLLLLLHIRGGGGGGGGGGDSPVKYNESDDNNNNNNNNNDGNYTLVSEDVVFQGHWRRVVSRRLRFPSGLHASFEVVSQQGSDQAVLIFCWDRKSRTCTLIREFMPSAASSNCNGRLDDDHNDHDATTNSTTNQNNVAVDHDQKRMFLVGLAAGMVEDTEKHRNACPRTAAQHELEEECRLKDGEWTCLTPPQGIIMDKYSTTRLHVFLVVDPISVDDISSSSSSTIRPRDEYEEGMQILPGVSIEQLLDYIDKGELTAVGGWACLLSLHKLRERGEID